MPRIRHTRERARPYRFNGVRFDEGDRELDVDDETAEQATAHPDVEYVSSSAEDDEGEGEGEPEPEPEGEGEGDSALEDVSND